MLLSVVVPTYNRRHSLQTTLNGLARQRFSSAEFEVVVVSDGSTDDTDVMLAEMAKQVPFQLRAVTQENAGPSRARNRGIQEAIGQVIVFLDDDVEPGPDFLAVHASHHKPGVNVAVIGPMVPDPVLRRREPCWIAWEHQMLEKQYRAWRTGEWTGVGPNHFYSGNSSVERHALLTVGGFDETFKRQEDVELAVRMQRECGMSFAFDAEAWGTHRPQRTFASWEKIPLSYGALDVERAERGHLEWQSLRKSFQGRNPATRASFRLCYAVPSLDIPLRKTLLSLAQTAWSLNQERAAINALSVLYNVLYLQAASKRLGTAKRVQEVLLTPGS